MLPFSSASGGKLTEKTLFCRGEWDREVVSSFRRNGFYLVSDFEAFGSSELNLTWMTERRERERKFLCPVN